MVITAEMQQSLISFVNTTLAQIDPNGAITTSILGAPYGAEPSLPLRIVDLEGHPTPMAKNEFSTMICDTTIEDYKCLSALVGMPNTAARMARDELQNIGASGNCAAVLGRAFAASIDANVANNCRGALREIFSRSQAAQFFLEAGDLLGAAKQFMSLTNIEWYRYEYPAPFMELAAGLLYKVAADTSDLTAQPSGEGDKRYRHAVDQSSALREITGDKNLDNEFSLAQLIERHRSKKYHQWIDGLRLREKSFSYQEPQTGISYTRNHHYIPLDDVESQAQSLQKMSSIRWNIAAEIYFALGDHFSAIFAARRAIHLGRGLMDPMEFASQLYHYSCLVAPIGVLIEGEMLRKRFNPEIGMVSALLTTKTLLEKEGKPGRDTIKCVLLSLRRAANVGQTIKGINKKIFGTLETFIDSVWEQVEKAESKFIL